MIIELKGGIILDDDNEICETMRVYARSKNLNDVRVFLATGPKGYKEYLIVNGEIPEFASQSAEAIGAHLDIMALQQQENEQ